MPMVTRGEPYAVLFNGDMIEGRHHKASHPLSQNKADQQKVALDVLEPIVKKCEGRLYYVSGSRAHSGEAGEDEEKLAKKLGAIPDEYGNYSRYEIFIRVGKCLVHASHHIGVTSSGAYEPSALAREFTEFCADCAKWGKKRPDILVRSHRHRHIEVAVPTNNGYGIIFVTSGWQLKTPFLYRTPGGRTTTPMLGGSLIRQGDEEHYTRHYTIDTPRTKTEVII